MTRDLLTPEDVAKILDVSTQTLATWRTTGRYDLPFVKIGRLVRYRQSDVDEFVDGFDEDPDQEEFEDEESDDEESDDEE
jgi:excisionase family DNA binding protein